MLNTVPLKGGWTKTRDLRHFLESKSAALKMIFRRIADDGGVCMSGMKLCVGTELSGDMNPSKRTD